MPNEFEKIPNLVRSLWRSENELRRAAWNGILLRKSVAVAHFAEARKHLDDGLKAFRDDDIPPSPPAI